MMRPMGLPTRETNSSHAASSRGPAQRQTTSRSDSDEYRVDLEVFDMLSPVRIVGAVRKGHWAGSAEAKSDASAELNSRRPLEYLD